MLRGRMSRWPPTFVALTVIVAGATFWGWESAPEPKEAEAHPQPQTPVAAERPVDPPLRSPAPPAPLTTPVAPDDAGSEADAGGAEFVASAPDSGPADSPRVEVSSPPPPALLFTIDAGARAPNDPRFTIRWGQAGLCGDEPLERMAQRRATLLATFIGVRRAGTLIFRDPEAPAAFVDLVGDSIAAARVIVTRLLGPSADVALPVVYVYASAEQMRDVACVNTATAGYYDGAIHLPATDADGYRTVVHEHVHHVLNALGLRKPMWLHEGLAMYAADERWWEDPRSGLTTWLRSAHLPFPALVEAFPHTADELFAGAAYYQSYQMVSFVAARSGNPNFFWLVDGVVSGRLPVQSCFGESVGLAGDQLEIAWRRFILSR